MTFDFSQLNILAIFLFWRFVNSLYKCALCHFATTLARIIFHVAFKMRLYKTGKFNGQLWMALWIFEPVLPLHILSLQTTDLSIFSAFYECLPYICFYYPLPASVNCRLSHKDWSLEFTGLRQKVATKMCCNPLLKKKEKKFAEGQESKIKQKMLDHLVCKDCTYQFLLWKA